MHLLTQLMWDIYFKIHSEMFLTPKICKLPFASQFWLLLPPLFLTSFNIYIFLWHQNAADLTEGGWIWSRALALFFKRKLFLILKLSEVPSLGVSPWNSKHLQALSCNCQNAKCWGLVVFCRCEIPILSSPFLFIEFCQVIVYLTVGLRSRISFSVS